MSGERIVALDFETGDAGRDSACAVALVVVEAGLVIRREERLICPPRRMSWHNISVHGLTQAQVDKAPPWRRVWPELAPLLEGAAFVVAHNVAFDRSVLEACCKADGLVLPPLRWECSLRAARLTWTTWAGHKLDECCRQLGIPLQHHNALSDAEACAEVWLRSRGQQLVRALSPAPETTTAATEDEAGEGWESEEEAAATSTTTPALEEPPAPRSGEVLAELGGHAAPALGEALPVPGHLSPAGAWALGRKIALGRAVMPAGALDPWVEMAILGGYQEEQHDAEILRLQSLLGLSEDEVRTVIAGGGQFVSGRKRKPIVHLLACGGCGATGLSEEGRGACTKCGWRKPANELSQLAG